MLKKPVVALILCVIIVISSTVISVHHDLDPRCLSVSEEFNESGGIADQLGAVCTASGGIVQLAEKYGVEEFDTFSVEDIASSLRFAVGEESPSALADLYRMLVAGTDKLIASLRLKELSAKDLEVFSVAETAYQAAQSAIGESLYNEHVATYLKNLGGFSRFMARLCGVRLPEYFR